MFALNPPFIVLWTLEGKARARGVGETRSKSRLLSPKPIPIPTFMCMFILMSMESPKRGRLLESSVKGSRRGSSRRERKTKREGQGVIAKVREARTRLVVAWIEVGRVDLECVHRVLMSLSVS
ncbi:hypothetical protein SCHPADRAFT_610289 [Schizopora paradoxa]|uniref:Uncharacterized protein n=1 Tax=Schizopora paradoxa TaxID=27342 RepID=A0A0H2RUF2_9AGAM|nr:hypothetical protein SCHPADRAFT_610289 [Schizopora paradoxa]